MPTKKDVKQARLEALCVRRSELLVKHHEVCLEIAKVDLDILRAGGAISGAIGGTIGGTIAGTIGGTIGQALRSEE